MTVQNPSSILPRGDSGPGLTCQFSEKGCHIPPNLFRGFLAFWPLV